MKRGLLFVAAAAIFFGINGLGIRWFFLTFGNVSPANVLFWGLMGSSSLAMFLQLMIPGPRNRMLFTIRRDLPVVAIVALLSSLGAFPWILSIKLAGAGPVSLLAKSQMIHSTILGILFLKERYTALEFAGFIIAIPGIAFISTLPGEVPIQAAVLTLLSAFIYSLQSFVVKVMAPNLLGREFSILRAVIMSLFIGILFSITGDITIIPVIQIVLLSLISISGLIIGRAFYFAAHNHLGIARLQVGMLLEPVFVVLMGILFLDEPFGWKKMVGMSLILFGLYLSARGNVKPGSKLMGILKPLLFQK